MKKLRNFETNSRTQNIRDLYKDASDSKVCHPRSCHYRGLSILSTTYKILRNILLASLTSRTGELTGYHQCGFQRKRSITIIYSALNSWENMRIKRISKSVICRLQESLWLIQEGGLYTIIEFGITMKLIRQIEKCLNETYGRVRVGKHLPDMFPTTNGLKQGDGLRPFIFNFVLDSANMKV
jgi:hypothetical protein